MTSPRKVSEGWKAVKIDPATIPAGFASVAQLDAIFNKEYTATLLSFDHPLYSDYIMNTTDTPAYQLLTKLAKDRLDESLRLIKLVQDCMEMVKDGKKDKALFEKCIAAINVFFTSLNDFRLEYYVYFNVTMIENLGNDKYKNELIESIAHARRTLDHLGFFNVSKKFLEKE